MLPARNSTLFLCNTAVRQDDAGRYCLNDLHAAAGGLAKHKPDNFLRLDSTKSYVKFLDDKAKNVNFSDVRSLAVDISTGRTGGTYVCKKLVYEYAAWISPEFNN